MSSKTVQHPPAKKIKRVSKSLKAGLTFPVTRFYRQFRSKLPRFRISDKSSIYMSAVLEYLTAEVLELAGGAAKQLGKRRLTPRAIFLGIAQDAELYEMNKAVTIPEAGVVPRTPHELLLRKKNSITPVNKAVINGQANPVKRKPVPVAAAFSNTNAPQPLVQYTGVKHKAKAVSKAGKGGKAFGLLYAVLSEKLLLTGQRLTVVQADIANIAVDAIVHPTDASYSLAGEIGSALAKIGGAVFAQELQNMLKDHGNIPSNGAMVSRGHGFGAPWVVHVNGPSWSAADSEKCVKSLMDSVTECLKAADVKKFKSIAVPSIGSGRAGFPKQLAAQTILRAISDYFKTNTTTNLNQMFFVLYDNQSIAVYISELGKLDA